VGHKWVAGSNASNDDYYEMLYFHVILIPLFSNSYDRLLGTFNALNYVKNLDEVEENTFNSCFKQRNLHENWAMPFRNSPTTPWEIFPWSIPSRIIWLKVWYCTGTLSPNSRRLPKIADTLNQGVKFWPEIENLCYNHILEPMSISELFSLRTEKKSFT